MSDEPTHKADLSFSTRLLRLIKSNFDPRAWAHLLKLVNYYNYTHVAELRKAKVGRETRISPKAGFANGQNIEIGDGTHIGSGCSIWAGHGDAKIVLGPDTLLGPNVMITAASYKFNEGSPVTRQAMKEADIILGRDIWIAYGAVILPGVTIGDGAIIAANSVVRGAVPAGAIMAGNPAKQIGSRDGF